MGTVSKNIAEDAMNGKYPEDNITTIVRYTNAWGGESYGITAGNDNRAKYLIVTEYVINPKLIWTKEKGRLE